MELIVLDDIEMLIITPPHTASGNLHRTICSPEHGGRWVIGPGPDGVWGHHVIRIAPGWENYKRLLVVRHPLSRLVGLWLDYDFARQRDDYVGPRDLTWPTFVEAVACDDAGKLSWFYRYTIARLVEPLDRVDEIVRYESLLGDLASYVGEFELEPAYHPDVDLGEFYRDERVRTMAVAWAQADLMRSEY